MIIKCIIFALAVAVRAAPISNIFVDEWRVFKMQYGKVYENEEEEQFRMQVYSNSSRNVYEHNKLLVEGKVSFRLQVNRYSDLLQEEFEKMMGMNENSDMCYDPTICKLQHFNTSVKIPKELDWRTSGVVTPVKNQEHYGGSWAFSAVGALESHHALKTNELVRLSEQNLIDCIKREGEGGNANEGFQYVVDQGGIDSEKSYSYVEGTNDECLYKKENGVEKITSCGRVFQDDEEQLKYALRKVGPISVSFYGRTPAFRHYKSGVLFSKECLSPTTTTHAALLVGYGKEYGVDYWLVKNSWGDDWGDNGYFKIARNEGSHCRIASKPNYPIG